MWRRPSTGGKPCAALNSSSPPFSRGLDAYAPDIEIPRRYGVEQCVGDTLGPGGVFRALRSIPVLMALGRELDEVAPSALLINYANPLAANCWAYDVFTGRPMWACATACKAPARCWPFLTKPIFK